MEFECVLGPSFTHLLFVDDCFLFCRATKREVNALKNILSIHEDASGQQINFQKSEIFFSRNVGAEAKVNISNNLQVNIAIGTGKYIGLPSMIGRSKKDMFKFIKDRVWRKINSWGGRSLSKVGKEVMIKFVLQSIPTYFMSIFLIPSSFGDEIEKMMNSFWWGNDGNRNKVIKWLSWDKLFVH